jgi:hypothetical protein
LGFVSSMPAHGAIAILSRCSLHVNENWLIFA